MTPNGASTLGAEELVQAANARFGLRKDVEWALIQLWAHHWDERKGFDGVVEALGAAFVERKEGGWRACAISKEDRGSGKILEGEY